MAEMCFSRKLPLVEREEMFTVVTLHLVSSQGSWVEGGVWDSGFGGILTLCVLNVHTMLFLFTLFILAALGGMWDLSFWTRD